jgi:exopolysaccharide biosynthesis predicted pyruvyltransferase EpsI
MVGNEYNEIEDIRAFLKKYNGVDVVYIPNPGSAGDSLIALGTIQVLNELGIKWRMGVYTRTYSGKIILYGGGGNLIWMYKCCKLFLKNNHKHNSIVILPQTISDVDRTLTSLGGNVTIFCREKKSYDYVTSIIKHKDRVYLSKDMALYAKHNFSGGGEGVCYAYREDDEKTSVKIPDGNDDISHRYTISGNTRSIYKIELVSNNLLRYISNFRVVHTNRLHVCIACHLLGKKVFLYPNNYYKNKAVYNYSLYMNENVIFMYE